MAQSVVNRTLNITTDGSGDAIVNGEYVIGYLEEIEWVDGDLADGVDAVISFQNRTSGVGFTVLTLTNANDDAIYRPRLSTHGNTGTAIGTTRPFVDGTPRVVVSSGGATKSGTVILRMLKA